MMIQGVSIRDMINQSIAVMTKPSVSTFEEYERRGGQREAFTYVGTAAAIAAVVGLLFGLLSGIGYAILAGGVTFTAPLIGVFITGLLVYHIGKSQGGTGSQDEVYYTLSLFMAPILAINGAVGNIPLLACLALPLTLALGIYQIYLGYLGIRSSMNLEQNKAIITMVAAWIAQALIGAVIGGIVAAIAVAMGVATGSVQLGQ